MSQLKTARKPRTPKSKKPAAPVDQAGATEPAPTQQPPTSAAEPSTKGRRGKPAKVKAPKENCSPVCLCGCGGTTGGGRFVLGHDAKLKSELLRTFRGDGLSAEQQQLVEQLGWQRFMTPAPAKGRRPLRDAGEVAALRAQLGGAIDAARDRTRSRTERLAAVRWLDRLFRGAPTEEADLDAVVAQLDGEAE